MCKLAKGIKKAHKSLAKFVSMEDFITVLSEAFPDAFSDPNALLNALSAICEEKYNCALEGITPEALVELLEPLCGGGGELTKDSRALSRGMSAKERTESHNMQSGNLPAVERV